MLSSTYSLTSYFGPDLKKNFVLKTPPHVPERPSFYSSMVWLACITAPVALAVLIVWSIKDLPKNQPPPVHSLEMLTFGSRPIATFPRRKKHHSCPTPTYPPRMQITKFKSTKTDNSLADFFLEKIIIPDENLTFWDIFQKVGTPSGYKFLKNSSMTIMPMLFPSTQAYPFPRPTPPVLSLHLHYLIQTNPEVASKYLLGLLTFLQFLGIKINQQGKLEHAKHLPDTDTVGPEQTYFHFFHILESLSSCGFYVLAEKIKIFILQKKIVSFKRRLPILPEDPFPDISKLKIQDGPKYWTSRLAQKFILDDGTPLDKTVLPQKWVSNSSSTSDPIFSVFKAGTRPLLEWRTEKGCWYFPHLPAPNLSTSRSTKPSQEEAPSIANQDRPSKTSMVTFSHKESLEKDHHVISTKRLAEYPPKTGQTKAHPRGTDTSLADFFLDKVTIPGTDLTFWDIVKNRASESFLKKNIDTIMPMLCPCDSPYPLSSNAPLLSKRLLHLIQTDPAIASKYLCGVFTILHFLGFALHKNAGSITAREGYQACAAYVKQNQSQWKIYQIIRSLLACGFYPLARDLYHKIMDAPGIAEEYGLSKKELTQLLFNQERKTGTLKIILQRANGPAYWETQTTYERTFEDEIAFDQTLLPKIWVSYQVHYFADDPLFFKFEEDSPPLLERNHKKGCWHLPHLWAPFDQTTEDLKN